MNPAAFGMPVCNKHGAHKAVARGADHGRYKTGEFTQASKADYKAGMAILMELETVGFNAGWMDGPRTRGRKTG
jgi:hypothetical protein